MRKIPLAMAAVAALYSVHGACEPFPSKPMRLVVAFAPGGASDVLARLLAARMTAVLGQTVLVDNRPSAGGIIGSDLVAKSSPDGYTLLVGSSATFAITPHLMKSLPFDVKKDFVPVSPFASLSFVLLTSNALAAKSVAQLISLAKARPEALSMGSAGNGTTTHMAAELFAHMAGVRFLHVPYKGAGPARLDLISGRIDVLFDAAITALPQIKAGKVTPVAVSSNERSTLLPDLPTIAEAGVPGYSASSWFGIFAPAGVPAPLVKSINDAITRSMSDAEVRKKMQAQGAEVRTSSAGDFRRFVDSEYQRYGELVRVANIKFN